MNRLPTAIIREIVTIIFFVGLFAWVVMSIHDVGYQRGVLAERNRVGAFYGPISAQPMDLPEVGSTEGN